MGFIRGALAVFLSILLFIVFLVGSAFLTLTLSLQYKNVYEHLEPIIKDTLETEMGVDISSEIEKELNSMKIQCESHPGEYVFSEQGYSITISCDALTQGTDAVIASGVNSLIESAYYKEYTCGFWSCFGEDDIPLFLFSEYAKNYWRAKFYWALTSALVLIAILFFLFKKKQNTFIVPGILLMAAAVPFLRIDALLSISGDRMILELLSIFFSKAKTVFRISFFTGIGLIVAGLVFKLFLVGFELSKFFHRNESKDVKEQVRKQVKEQVKKQVSEQIKAIKPTKSAPKSKKK